MIYDMLHVTYNIVITCIYGKIKTCVTFLGNSISKKNLIFKQHKILFIYSFIEHDFFWSTHQSDFSQENIKAI